MPNYSRSIITAGACVGLGLALQPLYASAELHQLALDAAEAGLLIGLASGAVLSVGYVHHRLQSWAAERPVVPSPAAMWAVSQQVGPRLAGEVAAAQAEERKPENDADRKLYLDTVRFCIIGESRRTFAYRDMCKNVDRYTWDCLTDHLESEWILVKGSGKRPTWFMDDWTAARVRVALQRHEKALPCPEQPLIVQWDDCRRHTRHTR
jgi:hypothetical protein